MKGLIPKNELHRLKTFGSRTRIKFGCWALFFRYLKMGHLDLVHKFHLVTGRWSENFRLTPYELVTKKRDVKRHFCSAVSDAPSQLGLWLVDACQALCDVARVITNIQNSKFCSTPRLRRARKFWLLIGQRTGAGTQCLYLGSQSDVELTQRCRTRKELIWLFDKW